MIIIGHRGARAEAPENTLGGFQYLSQIGIKAVEFDIRLSKDNELMVIHDASTLRTAGVDHSIEQTNAALLRTIDHRHHWGKSWRQTEPTPTLAQTLECLQGFQHIEIEVKAVDHAIQAESLVSQLIYQLKKQAAVASSAITITSFDVKIIQLLQQQSTFKYGFLVELPLAHAAVEFADQHQCQHIGWKNTFVNQELITLTKQAGFFCSVWTVNDVERCKQLHQWQVDGLITDKPTLVQSIIA